MVVQEYITYTLKMEQKHFQWDVMKNTTNTQEGDYSIIAHWIQFI